jgi:hypothetical protein
MPAHAIGLGTDQASDGRSQAVGAHHHARGQVMHVAGLVLQYDSGHAYALGPPQLPESHAVRDVGARAGRGVDQQPIQQVPAWCVQRVDPVAWLDGHRD